MATHHPVGPSSSGHVAHPELDQVLNPQAAGVVRQVQQVEVEGEVTFFHQRGAVVHHGPVHLVVIIRLCHHEPGGSKKITFKLIHSQAWKHICLNLLPFIK